MPRTSLIPALVLLSTFAAACGGAASGNQAARERELERLEEPPASRSPEAAQAGARTQDSRRTAIVAASERVA
ncbi:MAG TPA: hypothetical protein VFY65_11995, partial [Longimicrobium sp.]|nr:hypothetical protein [Longimicrobium sp.]